MKGASGVRNHRNRYYCPSLGRWPSTDPIEFDGGLNLYAYVHNDPIDKIDPTGLVTKAGCDAQYEADSAVCRSISGKCAAARKALCWAAAMEAYASCLGDVAADSVSQWVSDHQDAIVGTIVVVGGVVFIVATDGLGAIILVPAAAASGG
jgi:uncharacterized protein RhaS with RHS repeats